MTPMSPRGAVADPTFGDYLRVLRRRAGIILLVTVAVTGGALGFSFLQDDVYRATAEVALQSRSIERIFDRGAIEAADPARALNTQVRVIESQPVRDAVEAVLGPVPKVSATPLDQTEVIGISVENRVPARASEVANAFANAYIQIRRATAVDDVLGALEQVQSRVSELQGQIDAAPAAQRELLIQQQSAFRQQIDQLQVSQALQSGGVQLVDPADVPTSPVKPRPVRSSIVAAFLGLVLGIGLAFLIDHLDDSVKSKDDLERATSGLPALGLIPVVSGWRRRGEAHVISVDDPQSPAAEAYRTLRTGIQFLDLDRPTRTLQLTSSTAGEGKTTTLANLGVALARSGQRVVLVCCDLRRPRIHEFFGLDNAVGLTSVLLGKVSIGQALQPIRSQERLSLLASGPLPPNPSELLASARTAEVFTLLRNDADIVLIDCPPVLPVTDSLILSGRVDATLLVCAAGAVTRKELARSVELLTQVEAPLVGTVLNGVSSESSYGYNYQYYGYRAADNGHDPTKGRKARKARRSKPASPSW